MKDFENRLVKMMRHRSKWAARQGLTAYRIFDRDIPGYKCTVDWYAGHAIISSYPSTHPSRKIDTSPEELLDSTSKALSIPKEKVFIKVRTPGARGKRQYERLNQKEVRTVVQEGKLEFIVNLSDYNDTGLFLDHRLTRGRIRDEVKGKHFLNLFCYTGSFTVYAASGGAAKTTSVDLSNAYLKWTKENLEQNGLMENRHKLIREDTLQWLDRYRAHPFDLIFLDPPSYSVSKKMNSSLAIEKDYPELIAKTLLLLKPGGTLYFSSNYRGLDFDENRLRSSASRLKAPIPALVTEITPSSIPEDFRDRKIHRCFRISLKRE